MLTTVNAFPKTTPEALSLSPKLLCLIHKRCKGLHKILNLDIPQGSRG
uniref:Uncharacterized protein n=1 Tax=Anguilla anguilla TaxID=7936 RepID=A0A0E9TJ32_ANGAN